MALPGKLVDVFAGSARYRGAYGGRGSGKTRSFATMTAVRAYMFAMAGRSGIILCGREYMNSLEDSSMEEVKIAIGDHPWLARHFDIGSKYIRTVDGRVRYAFTGLRHSLDSIKSKAMILLAWIDEAENVSEVAWRKLLPTVREKDSEVWITWNPEKEHSPTNQRFRISPPPNSKIAEVNYYDNPWFPPELEELRQYDQGRLDLAAYAHIWDGAYLVNSSAQVLADKVVVREFEPQSNWGGPYFGLDWGFAQDPTAAVKCWVSTTSAGHVLYVEREAGSVGLELDETAGFIAQRIPGADKHTIRADSARPESISYVRRNGLGGCVAVEKWPGSVEDGIAHLRSYSEIVVHPRCRETINECRLYSYKVDRLTDDILPIIVDAYNHYIDAIRYAIGPMIRRRGQTTGYFGAYR